MQQRVTRWHIILALATGTLIGSASRVAAQAGNNPADEAQAKLAKRMAKVAREVYDLRLRGPTPAEEELYQWSRRWLDAELELADSKEKRLAAYRDHFTRMRDREARVKDLFKAGKRTLAVVAASEYYKIEAERWLERAKAAPAGK